MLHAFQSDERAWVWRMLGEIYYSRASFQQSRSVVVVYLFGRAYGLEHTVPGKFWNGRMLLPGRQ